MSKKIVPVSVLSMFIMLILVYQVCAITGAIGNARMVLRVDAGEKIEKYILVKNVNDVPVDIQISAEGDLKDYINIKDKEFKLEAGAEKKAYFTITAKEGSTESKINVKFIPEEGSGEKSGVGLSSTIVVITNANENGSGNAEDNLSNEENDTGQGQKTGLDIITSKFTGLSGGGSKQTALIILTCMTLIIFIILIVLIILKNRIAKKNQGVVKEEKEVKEVKIKTKKSAKRSGQA